jgi:ribosomal protein S27E
MCSEAIPWKGAKYVEREGGKGFFTELGCEDCRYNEGTVEQPVCGHLQGPRFIFNVRCANYMSKKVGLMDNGNKKVSS